MKKGPLFLGGFFIVAVLVFALAGRGSTGASMDYVSSTSIKHVTRIAYNTHNQYDDEQWSQNWYEGACSALALKSVMDSYGGAHQNQQDESTVGGILQVEVQLGVWTLKDGISIGGWVYQKIADHFGYSSDYSESRTLHKIVQTANGGSPVIVGIYGYYHNFFFNHILVLVGGVADQYVTLVDSSVVNLRQVSWSDFYSLWHLPESTSRHMSVIFTPIT